MAEPESDSLLLIPPFGSDGTLLERAANVAAAASLAVEIFYPLAERQPVAALPGVPAAAVPDPSAATGQTRAIWTDRCRSEVDAAAGALRGRGLAAAGRLEWAPSRCDAVLEAVETSRPRIVMTEARLHGRFADLLAFDDEVELIRRCPAPLWLVGSPKTMRGRANVLAAVDPTHEGDRGAAVDHAVLEHALAIARPLDAQVHAVHAFSPPTRLPGLIEVTAPDAARERYERAEDYHCRRLHALIEPHPIDKAHAHLLQGELVDSLGDLVEALGATLVVMGALSRGRLKRALLGGTAERLLRTLDVDVLVVKPPHFDRDAG